MKAQRFFRYLWRVDAVLILLATGAITFGIGALLIDEFGGRAAMRRNAEGGVPVATQPRPDLSLGHAEAVPGATVLRADLFVREDGRGFSSGGYNETRNILFIDPAERAAHWLLPDSDHVIAERSDVKDQRDPMRERVIATVVLVKPRSDKAETLGGTLLLFDSGGKNIVEVASDVRDIHIATVDAGELKVLYERNRRLRLAVFDSTSLTKKKEQEIEVPQLK